MAVPSNITESNMNSIPYYLVVSVTKTILPIKNPVALDLLLNLP